MKDLSEIINIRKINNYDVDCSYQLKSRLITFVLSLIVPLGIDYFYLEYYSIFFLIFFNVDKNFEKKYTKFKLAIIIIDLIFLGFYIINSILQGTGVIKDKNGFQTISDFSIE